MVTFVLIPGAWLGAWAWQPVTRRLRERGHDVYPVSLTGLGERAHLARPEVDLDTHITDVVNLFEFEDLDDAVLVGHSYAGTVVTGVTDRIPERVAQVVYIDAGPVVDGVAFIDLGPPEERERNERLIAERGDGWRWPVPSWEELEAGGASLAGLGAPERARFGAHAVDQPARTITQPIALENPARETIPALGILCTFTLVQVRDMIATGHPWFAGMGDERWRFAELPTGHWPMFSVPEALADLLAAELPA